MKPWKFEVLIFIGFWFGLAAIGILEFSFRSAALFSLGWLLPKGIGFCINYRKGERENHDSK